MTDSAIQGRDVALRDLQDCRIVLLDRTLGGSANS